MTNISRQLTPKPDRPIQPTTLTVIGEIQGAANQLGVPVFVVGAVARIILLENVYGLNAGRATTDTDFAFALDNWEQFHALKALLLRNERFSASEQLVHRLHFHASVSEPPYTVDLIPFGGIEADKNTIAWPPDMAIMMNVAGFGDALDAAVCIEASPDIKATVASLPGITILKLFAWADRRQESRKDAFDLVTLLHRYHEAGNEDRIYGDAIALAALEAVDYDPELAGAWLLGTDVSAMVSNATYSDLEALLHGSTRDRLIEDMSRALIAREDSLDYASRLLEQFVIGFSS